MAEAITVASSVTASTVQLAENIAKAAASSQGHSPRLLARLNLLKDVLKKVEARQHAEQVLEAGPVEPFEVVIGDAAAEQTGKEAQGLDIVTENHVFEIIVSGIHAQLEALSGLVATTYAEEHKTGLVNAPGQAQVELRLGEIESLRAMLDLFVADGSEIKLPEFLASLRLDKDLERFGVTADVIKESLNSFLSVAADPTERVQGEDQLNSPQPAPTVLEKVHPRQELDTDWIDAEDEFIPRPERQISQHNKAFRNFLIRDAAKNTSQLVGPLLRLNKAHLGGALIKPFAGLLDIMLNAAMAIPAPLLLLMAYLSMGSDNWHGALRYLQPALPMSRKQKSRSYEILILQAIGTCHEQLHDRELALANLTEALDLALVTPTAIYGGPVAVTCAATCLRILELSHKTDQAKNFYQKYYDRCMSYTNRPAAAAAPQEKAPRMPFADAAREAAALWMARNRYPLLVCLDRQQEAMDLMRAHLRHVDVRKDDWESCRVQVDLADVLCRMQGGDQKSQTAEEATALLACARDRGAKSKTIGGSRKAMMLRDIAIVTLLGLEDAAAAERDFLRCAELLAEQHGKTSSWRNKADIQFWLGGCQEVLGEAARASETFRRAARWYALDEKVAGTRWALLAECRSHIAARDRTEAEIRGLLLRLKEDLNHARVDYWPNKLLAYSYFYSGEIAQALGLLDDAREAFERALRCVEEHVEFYRGTLRGRQVFEGIALKRKLELRLAVM
ncbi:hypothetical protein OQA88_13182 [Cercophora sp. LCS_1]